MLTVTLEKPSFNEAKISELEAQLAATYQDLTEARKARHDLLLSRLAASGISLGSTVLRVGSRDVVIEQIDMNYSIKLIGYEIVEVGHFDRIRTCVPDGATHRLGFFPQPVEILLWTDVTIARVRVVGRATKIEPPLVRPWWTSPFYSVAPVVNGEPGPPHRVTNDQILP